MDWFCSSFYFLVSSFSRLRYRLAHIAVLLGLTLLTSGCTLQQWIGNDPTSLQLSDVVKFINTVIDYLAGFAGLVTSFVMIAGYQALLSAGNDEGIQRAKDTIKYSALGIVFLVFGYAIVRLIFAVFASSASPFSQ